MEQQDDEHRSPVEIMRSMMELAQICHFCTTFRPILHISVFSRSDLEDALLHPTDEFGHPNALLAEVHYKLCRSTGHLKNIDTSDWEQIVTRRVFDKWKKSFEINPLKEVSYPECSLRVKILILLALCEWKLRDAAMIEYVDTQFLQADYAEAPVVAAAAVERNFKPKAIGSDDRGHLYWHFSDSCWVYCEANPIVPPTICSTYKVVFASPRYIRIGIDVAEAGPAVDYSDPKHANRITQVVSGTLQELVDRVVEEEDGQGESEEESEEEPEKKTVYLVPQRRSARKRQRVDYGDDGERLVKAQVPAPVEASEEDSESEEEVDTSEAEESSDELLEIQCDQCQLIFDPLVQDPPLQSQPKDEWKCMDCLVSSARGLRSRRSAPVRTSTRTKRFVSYSPAKKKKKKKVKKPKRTIQIDCIDPTLALDLFLARQKHLKEVELVRMEALGPGTSNTAAVGDVPWTVVSSNLAELKLLVAKLEGGSLEQAKLRTKLNRIRYLVEIQQHAKHKKRNHQLELLGMPRRLSSRIARSSIKSMAEEELLDERTSTRSRTSRTSRFSRADQLYHPDQFLTPEEKEAKKKEEAAQERIRRANRRLGAFEELPEEEDVLPPAAAPTTTTLLHPVQPIPELVKMEMESQWVDWVKIHAVSTPLRNICCKIVDRLLRDQRAIPFSRPVQPVLDGCPDYPKFVTHPMDLSTVRSRVMMGKYPSWPMFKADVQLIWSNCKVYNAPASLIVQYARTLASGFDSMCLESETNGAAHFRDREEDSDSDSGDGESSDDGRGDSSSSSSSSSSEEEESTVEQPMAVEGLVQSEGPHSGLAGGSLDLMSSRVQDTVDAK